MQSKIKTCQRQVFNLNGGDLEIRTLARPGASYRFSRPTPSTTWVNLRFLVDPADPDTATNRL